MMNLDNLVTQDFAPVDETYEDVMFTFKLIGLLFQFSPGRNTQRMLVSVIWKKKRIYDILKTSLGV